MSVESLLDTNIIIYRLESNDIRKYKRAEQLIQLGLLEGRCCISRQVLQETLNVVTKKLHFDFADCKHLLEKTLLPLCKDLPNSQLYYRSLQVQFRYQYSFYDSLIIAAALEAGCQTLYSEDLQHMQRIENLTIFNPFHE